MWPLSSKPVARKWENVEKQSGVKTVKKAQLKTTWFTFEVNKFMLIKDQPNMTKKVLHDHNLNNK